MHPIRAFTLSFVAGLALLFAGYGAFAAMQPPRLDHTITV